MFVGADGDAVSVCGCANDRGVGGGDVSAGGCVAGGSVTEFEGESSGGAACDLSRYGWQGVGPLGAEVMNLTSCDGDGASAVNLYTVGYAGDVDGAADAVRFWGLEGEDVLPAGGVPEGDDFAGGGCSYPAGEGCSFGGGCYGSCRGFGTLGGGSVDGAVAAGGCPDADALRGVDEGCTIVGGSVPFSAVDADFLDV